MRRHLPAIALAAALGACHPPVEEPKALPERLPGPVCDQARQAVEKMSDSGALVLKTPVDGVIPQEVWIPAAPAAKDAMLNAIGLAATCGGEPRLEQEVTIHSEYGDLMTRRVVKTSYSTADALSQ